MKILVACEESGVVTQAFRNRGHDAWSCDLLPTSGPFPQYHLQQDVIGVLGQAWDMVIAFPPCDHLSASGARWFKQKQEDGRQPKAIEFFLQFTSLITPKVAIENPIGIMSTIYRKPDQIIQPFHFGHEARKATCLWLKGLPPLLPTSIVGQGELVTLPDGTTFPKWISNANPRTRKVLRSKTFQGIATAMAEQWG